MIIRRGTDGALIYALSICQMSQQGHWKYSLTSIIVPWWYAVTLYSLLILLVFQDGALGQQGQEASHGAEAQNGCEKSYEPASAEQL